MTIHIAKWLPSLALIVIQPFTWSSEHLAGHGLISGCSTSEEKLLLVCEERFGGKELGHCVRCRV